MHDSVCVHVIVCEHVCDSICVCWGGVCVRVCVHTCVHTCVTTAAMRYKVRAVSSWVGGTGTLSPVRTLQIR